MNKETKKFIILSLGPFLRKCCVKTTTGRSMTSLLSQDNMIINGRGGEKSLKTFFAYKGYFLFGIDLEVIKKVDFFNHLSSTGAMVL